MEPDLFGDLVNGLRGNALLSGIIDLCNTWPG